MLIQKYKAKVNITSNSQVITCLPLVWKLFTRILADEIYDCLKKKVFLQEELMGWKRKSKERRDILFNGRIILQEVRIKEKPSSRMDWL